ncbi:A-kinase anchor protein 8-like [Corapipo altera]|uniref:A-kinase anchor protein 8-like n=1 Tax=Corapipo altera TaxID=415028 RepID=UPI000FD651EC|nr:A-kinase anchor protein 8-like [Corapipo altera]
MSGIKDINAVIQQIHRDQDLTQEVGMEHFLKKVEAAHCAACDLFLPMQFGTIQKHLKSLDHNHNRRAMLEQSKKSSLVVARSILNNKLISKKLERYLKGENPFTDDPEEKEEHEEGEGGAGNAEEGAEGGAEEENKDEEENPEEEEENPEEEEENPEERNVEEENKDPEENPEKEGEGEEDPKKEGTETERERRAQTEPEQNSPNPEDPEGALPGEGEQQPEQQQQQEEEEEEEGSEEGPEAVE